MKRKLTHPIPQDTMPTCVHRPSLTISGPPEVFFFFLIKHSTQIRSLIILPESPLQESFAG